MDIYCGCSPKSELIGILNRGKLIEVDLTSVSETNSFGFQLRTLLKEGTCKQR